MVFLFPLFFHDFSRGNLHVVHSSLGMRNFDLCDCVCILYNVYGPHFPSYLDSTDNG